ncbi:MAG: hypothetical protein CMQ19_03510 [Gammaproteobacteria bacterium]|nr:hypothetical protein [Gammaproteobacteria bacterium]
MRQLAAILVFAIGLASGNAVGEELASATSAVDQARVLIAAGKGREAQGFLTGAREQFPDDVQLLELKVQLLFDNERFGEAHKLIESSSSPTPLLTKLLASTNKHLERLSRSNVIAVVAIQKKIDIEDFATAIAIADIALGKFPEKEKHFLTLKGEALYKNNELETAEIEFRKALIIDPLNPVAKKYVAEIRSTLQAQTSEEWAEWVLIFKDKVGDFIVTFLALFAAFVVNSFVGPLMLQFKLNRARRSFERGNYNEFLDLSEGLLDQENFSTLRANFRFILDHIGYEDAREILNQYVVTLERLPSLLRILEREHEKMLADP